MQVQMSRAELGRLRSCKGANRKLLSRLNIVKRVRRSFTPCTTRILRTSVAVNLGSQMGACTAQQTRRCRSVSTDTRVL